jgi:hypothetical protein
VAMVGTDADEETLALYRIARALPLAELGRTDEAAELVDEVYYLVSDRAYADRISGHVAVVDGEIEAGLDHFGWAADRVRDEGDVMEFRCLQRQMIRVGVGQAAEAWRPPD